MLDSKLVTIKEYFKQVTELSNPASDERRTVLSEWKRKGEYPFKLVELQFELLKYYFDTTSATCSVANDSRFLTLVHRFINALHVCYIDDARFFYSQTLSVGTREVCMYDLLKRISDENSDDIQYEMELFALFLVTNNPSYVVPCKGLQSIYGKTNVGSGFSLEYFRKSVLPLLCIKASPEILKKLLAFASRIQKHSTLSAEDIAELKAIFALRWSEIAGGPRDYTRNQKGVNADWIMVAQLLSGAGIFPINYYNILMPTLEHTRNTWTRDRLVYYPLSHYILSENGRRLILLDACADHYKTQPIEPRRFLNASVHPVVDFTPIERPRICFSAPRFRHFENVFNNENHNKEELSLKRSTIRLVVVLLEASLEEGITEDDLDQVYTIFDEGLDSLPGDCRARVLTSTPLEEDIVKVLSSQEVLIIRSGNSYEIGFCNNVGDYQQRAIDNPEVREFLRPYEEGDFVTHRGYKDKLNKILTSFECRTRIDEERLRFLDHRIKFGTFDLNPKYILGQIALGQDPDITVSAGCVRGYCNNFAQLVTDYSSESSDFNLSPAIENIIADKHMRENATKMVFSDALCSQGLVIDNNIRNIILLCSLLTYPFSSSSEKTYTMSFLNYENTAIDSVVPHIFEQLTNEFKKVLTNRAYRPVDIMNDVVLPFIAGGRVGELPLETQNWFKLIRTKDFFSNKCEFYDSNHLFLALSSLGSYTHVFLDEVLQIIIQQPGDTSMHLLDINIKLLSFLSRLNEEQKGHVFKSLADTRRNVTYSDFFRGVYHFITSRMSVVHSSPPSSSGNEFFSSMFARKPMNAHLSGVLARTEEAQLWDSYSSVEQVLSLIQEVVDSTPRARCYSSRTNSSSSGSVNGMTPRSTVGSAVQSPNLTCRTAPGDLAQSITLSK